MFYYHSYNGHTRYIAGCDVCDRVVVDAERRSFGVLKGWVAVLGNSREGVWCPLHKPKGIQLYTFIGHA